MSINGSFLPFASGLTGSYWPDRERMLANKVCDNECNRDVGKHGNWSQRPPLGLEDFMRDIIDGFLRFQREVYPQRVELFKQLATTQNPKVLFVTCSDSRVVPELLTQREPGELFVIRNAGNIVPSYGPEPGGVSATVEYAVAVLGVQDIVICGHSDCGAMGAISRCTCLDHLPAVANWLRHSDAAKAINAAHEFDTPSEKLDGLVRENVIAQLANLRTHPSVALALEQGRMNLHGWVYDIEAGGIDALDGATRQFVSLADSPSTVAIAAGKGRQI